eukprot:SAG31_NODE_3044_length_4751_cov_29.695615_6_plen_80_part_00
MTVPSIDWLLEKFPKHGEFDSPTAIVDAIVGYARAWDRVTDQWDEGRLDALFPTSNMMPWLAMYRLMAWSRERGEAKRE